MLGDDGKCPVVHKRVSAGKLHLSWVKYLIYSVLYIWTKLEDKLHSRTALLDWMDVITEGCVCSDIGPIYCGTHAVFMELELDGIKFTKCIHSLPLQVKHPFDGGVPR